MDRGAWKATVHGVIKSLTQLRDLASTHKDQRQINDSQGLREEQKLAANGHGGPFVDCGRVVQFYKLTKDHRTSHLKWESFILCKSYLNEAVNFKKVKQANGKQ